MSMSRKYDECLRMCVRKYRDPLEVKKCVDECLHRVSYNK